MIASNIYHEACRKIALEITSKKEISKGDVEKTKLKISEKYKLVKVPSTIQNMQLIAWSEGLGSCIYTGVKEREMKKEYNIPGNLTIATVIGFGHPKRKIKGLKNRKELSEIIFSKRYGEKLRLL